ncbi:hypothetical protein LGH82_22785 [Mesorhizobium sp. PAMC28654]|uniref:hypothetical protein n=1 Tax=Mesorhizobium sp. PAMC28654 TaxID=2880934 RepID=UPI001D09B585|nr:hypothetical protein [Mesorhizobium sp. PAMC28654]UDL87968.1 hypothetical protein LGH82_22785 [Mesorhizobium sp. PAMC28654]
MSAKASVISRRPAISEAAFSATFAKLAASNMKAHESLRALEEPADARPVSPRLQELEKAFHLAWAALKATEPVSNMVERKRLDALAPRPVDEEWSDSLRARFNEVPIGRISDSSIPAIAEIQAISERNAARRAAYNEACEGGEAEWRKIDLHYRRLLDKADQIARRANRVPARSLGDLMVKVRIHNVNQFDDSEILDVMLRDIARLNRASKKTWQPKANSPTQSISVDGNSKEEGNKVLPEPVKKEPKRVRAKAKSATAQDYAALEFEPLLQPECSDGEAMDYMQERNRVLEMMLTFSYKTMFKTKAEIGLEVEKWDNEEGRMVMRAFQDATSHLDFAARIIRSAEVRILSGACASQLSQSSNTAH